MMTKVPDVRAEVSAILWMLYAAITVAEPLVFRDQLPGKNAVLFGLALIALPSMAAAARRRRSEFILPWLFVLMAAVAWAAQANLVSDIFFPSGTSVHGFTRSVLLYSALCLGAGASLPLLAKSKLLPYLLAPAVLFTFITFVVNVEGARIWWGYIIYSDGSSPNHLTVDEVLAVLLFAAIAVYRAPLKYIMGLAIIVCLLVGAGRATIILTLLAIPLGNALVNRRRTLFIYAAIFPVIVAAASIFQLDRVEDIYEVLFPSGFSGDDSLRARNMIFAESSGDLFAQFWFGDATLIVRRLNDLGLYMHNLLSAWQFYGFPSFAVLVLAIIVAVRRSLATEYRELSGAYFIGLYLLLYAIVGVLTSKFVGVYSLWFALGCWSVMPRSELHKQQRHPGARPGFRPIPGARSELRAYRPS